MSYTKRSFVFMFMIASLNCITTDIKALSNEQNAIFLRNNFYDQIQQEKEA